MIAPKEEGSNFLRIWNYNGHIWSEKWKIENGRNYRFLADTDQWDSDSFSETMSSGCMNIRYIILGGIDE